MKANRIHVREAGSAAVLGLLLAAVVVLSAPASAGTPGDSRYIYSGSEQISQAQAILLNEGYLKQDSYKNGDMDAETRAAVRNFQSMHSMAPTGLLDTETLAELLSHGSPYDADKDGIADKLDQCPGTRYGVPVDTVGCARDRADRDADNDTISDRLDLCPDTPAGTSVDQDGCPV